MGMATAKAMVRAATTIVMMATMVSMATMLMMVMMAVAAAAAAVAELVVTGVAMAAATHLADYHR